MQTIAPRMRGRKQGKRSEEWILVFQERLRVLLMDRRVKGSHWRLLLYLVSCATFAQDVTLKQCDMARDLGMAGSDVSQRLRDLEGFGVIERVVTHAYPPTYRLNSLYTYKGRWEKLRQRRAYQRREASHA